MSSKAKKSSKSSKARSMTKTQLMADVAAKAGLSKAQVGSVMSSLVEIIGAELRAGRPIAIPGVVKITKVHKAATPAKTMYSHFTKENIQVRAKPARSVVKVRALKALKDMV